MTLSIRDIEGSNIETAQITGIGQLLKKAREAVGYTIEDLGETCGLTTAEIKKVEDGVDPDENRIRRIASALRFDLGQFTTQ